MGTPMRSFRLDDETWEKFSNLCKLNYSNSSEQIVKFICSCIANDSVLVDSEMVPKDILDKRIEEALNRQTQISYTESTGGGSDKSNQPLQLAALNPLMDYLVEDLCFWTEDKTEKLEEEVPHHVTTIVSFLKTFGELVNTFRESKKELEGENDHLHKMLLDIGGPGSNCFGEFRGPNGKSRWGETAFGKIEKLEEFQKYFSETFSSKDYKSFKGWVKKVDESVESTKLLKEELEELKALVGNLTKPQELEELPYKQRLVYNHTPKYKWEGHAFRSKQEMDVAIALDALEVVYGPNVGVRVTEGDNRKTREVDFMVYLDGHTGILECDSVEFHNAENDIERDRNFQRQGIYFIKRYTSKECLDPNWVAEDFIKSMRFFYAK